MSKLRGKDFCNCPHALMLLEAIDEAVELLELAGMNGSRTIDVLQRALAEHKAASDAYNEAYFGPVTIQPEPTPCVCIYDLMVPDWSEED